MGEEVSAVVSVGNLIIAAVGITAVILIGVWRIVASYESRNETAHEGLGNRIDGLRTELREDNATLRTELREDIATLRTELRDDRRGGQ